MPEKKKRRSAGVWNTVKTVFSWLTAALAIGLMIFAVLSSCFLGGEGASLFGYRFFAVKSDSMAATDFATGDVIITKEVDPSTLRDGDVITFVSQNWGSFGETVTHKIRRSAYDSTGKPGFITYSTTTGSDDETVVTYDYIIGQYRGRIPKIGALFEFIKTAPGMLICLFFPFVLVLLIHGGSLIRSFSGWRREQVRAIEQKNEVFSEMLEELAVLEAQYEGEEAPALLHELREIVNTAKERLTRIEEEADGDTDRSDESDAGGEPQKPSSQD